MIPNGQMGNLQDLFISNIMNGGTGSSLHLFTNNVLLTPTIALGDLTEATFGGYDFDNPHDDWLKVVDSIVHRGSIVLPANVNFVVTSGDDLPQVIYGYYVVSDTGELAAVERLPAPIVLSEIYQGFTIDVHFVFNASIQDNPDAG